VVVSEGINLFSKSGLMQYILPELQLCIGFEQRNYHHRKDVFEHILKVIDASRQGLRLWNGGGPGFIDM
jgi:tRNA nucleotidyltransferase (CCA-adding enzyme)